MSDGLPNPQRALAFTTYAIATTMAVLDSAVVNVALPAIGQQLAVSAAESIWVVNAYQLAVTVSLLPLAALGDVVGYKRVYMWGLAVFTAASIACGFAHSLWFLASARVVQGLGAAGIMSVNIALVRFMFPKAQLGVGVGYASLVVAASSVAGPTVASAVLSIASWQWLFFVNAPLGLIALLLGARALPITPVTGHSLDGVSVTLNALTFGLLIAGLTAVGDSGGKRGGLIMVIAAIIIGIVFVLRERRVAMPILPLDLLRLPVYGLSLMTSICSFAAQTMAFVALPFFFERTLGRSEAQAGLLMTPWPMMTALVAPLAGRLSDNRFRPEKLGSVGLIVLAAGLAALSRLGNAPSLLDICWRMGVCGLGFGLFQSPNNRVIMGSAPRERSGGASGLQSMGRLLGQSLGAVTVAMVFGFVQQHQTALLTSIGSGLGLVAACSSGLRRTSA